MANNVPTDPWSAGIMGAASVASSALAKPSLTNGSSTSSAFDNSGWSVNVAGAGATAVQTATTDKSGSLLGLSQLTKNPLVLVLLAFVVYEFAKHK